MANLRKPPETLTEGETIKRRDEAVRRALNTPPKPLKEMKKTGKKRQDSSLTASGDGKRT